MPYRLLPRSDAERITALSTAIRKWDATAAGARAYSEATHDRLVPLHANFRRETGEVAVALSAQTTATAKADLTGLALERVISHFIQVFQFAVARGTFPREARALYHLDVNGDTLPPLRTQGALGFWAQRLIDGETARRADGGLPMAMPAIEEVAAAYTAYSLAAATQSDKKDTYDDEQQDVTALRPAIDEVIDDVWSEVEFTFRKENGPGLRRKARPWGVVYVTRPDETPDPEEPREAPAPADDGTAEPAEPTP